MRKVALFFTIMVILVMMFSSISYAEEQKMMELTDKMQIVARYTEADSNIVDETIETINAGQEEIEKISPQAWRIIVRERYAKAILWLVLPLGFLIVSFAYKEWSDKWTFESCEDDKDKNTALCFRAITQYLFFIGSSGWLVISTGLLIRVIINPEYCAIRKIFQIVLSQNQ